MAGGLAGKRSRRPPPPTGSGAFKSLKQSSLAGFLNLKPRADAAAAAAAVGLAPVGVYNVLGPTLAAVESPRRDAGAVLQAAARSDGAGAGTEAAPPLREAGAVSAERSTSPSPTSGEAQSSSHEDAAPLSGKVHVEEVAGGGLTRPNDEAASPPSSDLRAQPETLATPTPPEDNALHALPEEEHATNRTRNDQVQGSAPSAVRARGAGARRGAEGAGGACEYERQREERIRQNQERMAQLGLATAVTNVQALASGPRPPAKRKTPRSVAKPAAPAAPVPARRSGRLRNQPASLAGELPEAWGELLLEPAPAPEPEPEIDYDDSAVCKYTCDMSGGGGGAGECLGSGSWRREGEGRALERFSLDARGALGDPSLQRIYSVHSWGRLLVAGGHGGRVAIFDSLQEKAGEADERDSEVGLPLMSFRAHKGWVSEVQLLGPASDATDSALLLSAANDAVVRVWDVNKRAPDGSPKELASVSNLHSSGIWSMHAMGNQVLTSSKDGSVELSTLTSSSLLPQRTFDGYHAGVVKCVRQRDGFVFADCGADGDVCVVDTRLSSPVVHTFAAHPLGANFVEWHGSDTNLLLSAGGDPFALLHDLRTPSEPLFRFLGHMSPKHANRGRPPFRSVFVEDTVATSGEGSEQLSLYCAKTGRTISRGQVGFDASTVYFGSDMNIAPMVLAEVCKGRAEFKALLHLYRPQWSASASEN